MVIENALEFLYLPSCGSGQFPRDMKAVVITDGQGSGTGTCGFYFHSNVSKENGDRIIPEVDHTDSKEQNKTKTDHGSICSAIFWSSFFKVIRAFPWRAYVHEHRWFPPMCQSHCISDAPLIVSTLFITICSFFTP